MVTAIDQRVLAETLKHRDGFCSLSLTSNYRPFPNNIVCTVLRTIIASSFNE